MLRKDIEGAGLEYRDATAARYTHIDLAEQSNEVQKLPVLLGRTLWRTDDADRQEVAENRDANGHETTKKRTAI